MSADHPISDEVRALAELFADRTANQMSLAINELREALTPGRKVRAEAAQRVVMRTIALEDGTATVRPTPILGRGITEQRARVTLWCGTGNNVFIGVDKGAVQNSDTRIQLIPLVPIVLLDASELFAQSPDAAATITMIVEEYDAP